MQRLGGAGFDVGPLRSDIKLFVYGQPDTLGGDHDTRAAKHCGFG